MCLVIAGCELNWAIGISVRLLDEHGGRIIEAVIISQNTSVTLSHGMKLVPAILLA